MIDPDSPFINLAKSSEMKLFRGTRQFTVTEEVEVSAETMDKAREKFENDTEDVVILNETDGIFEVKQIYFKVENNVPL